MENELKSPLNLKDADVVIFDGECSFCQNQVRRLVKWDGKDRLCYISLHDDFVKENYPQLTHEQMMEQIYVVHRESGRAYGGASAIRFLSRRLSKLWWAVPFLHIPFSRPFIQWGYRQIAKRRYQISQNTKYKDDAAPVCEDDVCKTHFN